MKESEQHRDHDDGFIVSVGINESNATKILHFLFDRGHLHRLSEDKKQTALQTSEGNQQGASMSQESISKTLVALESGDSFCTLSRLIKDCREYIIASNQKRQRVNLSTLAQHLDISLKILERNVLTGVSSAESAPSFFTYKGSLVSTSYLDNQLLQFLEDHTSIDDGSTPSPIPITDVARDLDLPADRVCTWLLDREASNYRLRRRCDGAWTFLSEPFWDWLQTEVVSRVCNSLEPMNVTELAQGRDWHPEWIREAVQSFTEQGGTTSGEWYCASSPAAPLFYHPPAYLHQQSERIQAFFREQGCITAHICWRKWQASVSRMQSSIADDGNTILRLSHSIVNRKTIIDPLVDEIREMGAWIQLSGEPSTDTSAQFLPFELLRHHPEDVKELLEKIWFEENGDKDHQLYVDSSATTAVLFRADFWAKLRQELPQWIRSWAQSQAESIILEEKQKATNYTSNEAAEEVVSAKEKHRIRAANKTGNHDGLDAISFDFGYACGVSTENILQRVLQQYPGLEEAFPTPDALNTAVQAMLVDVDELREMSIATLRGEVSRLQKITQNRVEQQAASNFANDLEAFEDSQCFANACYLLQLHYKFILHARSRQQSCNDDDIARLEGAFLGGICADFTRRLSEYALVRAESKEITLELDYGVDETLPRFCTAIDMARLRYPRLSIQPEDQNQGVGSHVTVLKASLRSSVSGPLSELWNHCSSKNGSVDIFLDLVKEHSLAICGLPFKVLDKKVEKKLLALRKKQLISAALQTNDLATRTDYCVAVAWQNIKYAVLVSSAEDRSCLVSWLASERKIEAHFVHVLEEAVKALESAAEPATIMDHLHNLLS